MHDAQHGDVLLPRRLKSLRFPEDPQAQGTAGFLGPACWASRTATGNAPPLMAHLRDDHYMSPRPGTKAYTVASTATRTAIDAAHRGTLIALRDELDILCVEVETDASWPADVAWALEALQPRRRRRRTLLTRRPKPYENVADLRPGDDRDFAIAMAVAPYTSYAIGITHDAGVAYTSYDRGEEPYFELTEAEHVLVTTYLAANSADPELLIRYEEQPPPDKG